MDKPPDQTPSQGETRQKTIHQPKDKSAKEFYGDEGMMREFLDKHLPRELLQGLDMSGVVEVKTEYRDPKFRVVRHVDLMWKVPFRDSWLYLLVLFEAQSTVDWRMPVSILLGTALVYREELKKPEVQKSRKLPPVLPIVVHVGTEAWNAPTSLEELLPEEAASFVPFALGSKFLLVSEAEEARNLERADTPRTAALKLRYARDHREFREALERFKELVPDDNPSRQALVAWVRSSLIDAGAKEEKMAELRELEDLKRPAVDSFWAKGIRGARREGRKEGRKEGREEGREEARHEQRTMLVRQALRRFGAETAEALAAILAGVSDRGRLDEVADLVVDCDSGRDLLAQAAKNDSTSG